MQKKSIISILFSGLLLTPSVVLAHAHLLKQLPAADSLINQIPHEIQLEFSEPIEAALSHITVTDEDKTIISAKKIQVATDNDRKITVPFQSTPKKGTYQVNWQVIAKDGHQTSGHYQFTIASK